MVDSIDLPSTTVYRMQSGKSRRVSELWVEHFHTCQLGTGGGCTTNGKEPESHCDGAGRLRTQGRV